LQLDRKYYFALIKRIHFLKLLSMAAKSQGHTLHCTRAAKGVALRLRLCLRVVQYHRKLMHNYNERICSYFSPNLYAIFKLIFLKSTFLEDSILLAWPVTY